MKTPDEYLNEFSTDTTTKGRVKWDDAIKAIRAAVKDACQQQRDNCADAYIESANQHGNYTAATDRAITYAPQPKGV